MKLRIHVLLPAVLALAACTPDPGVRLSTGPSPLRSRAAGCWELHASRGLFGRLLPEMRVRLDTAADGGALQMRVLAVRPATHPGYVMTWWGTYAGGDSLGLTFSTGYAGTQVRAALRGDQLRGHAASFSDVLLPYPGRRGRVRGVRVPCPAEAPGGG